MVFSLKEINDISIQIEEINYYFYKNSHQKFINDKNKDILSYLAEEELRHNDVFIQMLENIETKEVDLPNEYFEYLKAIGYHTIFKTNEDVDEVLSTLDNIKDVFNLALRLEKDSILWYTELINIYSYDKEAITVLNQLINEEKKHIVTLINLNYSK